MRTSARFHRLPAIVLLAATFLLPCAWADHSPGIARIGVLNPQSSSTFEEAFKLGLNQLGYVEGRNIAIEWRRAADTPERMRSLAADLADSRVDLIVAIGSPATRAALDATSKPVVFLAGDPVASHFAASLAKPGRRATGVSGVYTEMMGKQLELLHQLAPRARRIIAVVNPANPGLPPALANLQRTARTLELKLVLLTARNVAELDAALRGISHGSGDAVLISGDVLAVANRYKIARAVRASRMPAVFPYKEYHEAGVLMSYGPDNQAAMRRVAMYVDRILKGAKPSELPVEQMDKYELVVDLRIARELGIEIPESILVRANVVMR